MSIELDLSGLDHYKCIEPEVGEKLIDRYPEKIPQRHRRDFETHILACDKCRERIKLVSWMKDGLRKHSESELAVEELSEQGIRLFISNQFEKAIEKFVDAIKLDNNFADAYYGCGLCYCSLGRFEEAVSAYKKALKLEPDNSTRRQALAEAFYNIGVQRSKDEKYNEAITYNAPEIARFRYQGPNGLKEEQRADQCTECSQCVEACPQEIPIPEWLQTAHALLGSQ